MDVRVEDLTAKYGDTIAVDDLSLDVHDGEVLVLLGPSGCGKTTTMRSVVGLETPHAGRIMIGDRTVFDSETGVNVAVNKRGMGMVFQSYAVWPHMTVEENVIFPLQMQRKDRKEARDLARRALRMVGLEGYESRNASMLSGGQMQRIAFARSIVGNPSILLLDEPLSNLDAKLRDELRFQLREVQRELEITTVYVTHDQSEALALADRIAIMRDGRIVQLDEPHKIYESPNCVFSAQFVGVDNVLAVSVIGVDDHGARVRIGESTNEVRLHKGDANGHATGFACLRDDEIVLSGSDRSSEAAGDIVATVRSSTYLGEKIRYDLALEEGEHIYASTRAGEQRFQIGDRVSVSTSPGAGLFLSD